MVGVEVLTEFGGPLSLELLGLRCDSNRVNLDVDLGNVGVAFKTPDDIADDRTETRALGEVVTLWPFSSNTLVCKRCGKNDTSATFIANDKDVNF